MRAAPLPPSKTLSAWCMPAAAAAASRRCAAMRWVQLHVRDGHERCWAFRRCWWVQRIGANRGRMDANASLFKGDGRGRGEVNRGRRWPRGRQAAQRRRGGCPSSHAAPQQCSCRLHSRLVTRRSAPRRSARAPAPGLRSRPPHLHRDCAHARHICTGTALAQPPSLTCERAKRHGPW